MTEEDVTAHIADLQARVNELEKLPPRVAGIEKAMWGTGGVVATIGFLFGLMSDWIKAKFGG